MRYLALVLAVCGVLSACHSQQEQRRGVVEVGGCRLVAYPLIRTCDLVCGDRVFLRNSSCSVNDLDREREYAEAPAIPEPAKPPATPPPAETPAP